MKKRFEQGPLTDMEVVACGLGADYGDESFEVLIEKMKKEKAEEITRLSQDLEKLEAVNEISDKDFFRQAAIYCLSKEQNCSMVEAEAIYTKAKQEQDAKPKGPYARIAESLRTSKYSTTDEKPQREKGKEEVEKLTDDEFVEWVENTGTAKLQSLKKKYGR